MAGTLFRIPSSGLVFRVAISTIPDVDLGLFALDPIEAGAHIGYYGGVLLTEEEAKNAKGDGINGYVFELVKGRFVDGYCKRNALRYVNHSRGSAVNCTAHTVRGRIAYKAKRRIAPGEELFLHYGNDYWKGGYKKREKRTAAKRKRG